MKGKLLYIIFFICLLPLASCADQDMKQKEKRINDYVDARLQNHKRFKQQTCLENIEKSAKKEVDRYIKDNEDKILKRPRTESLPPKPQHPGRKLIEDTLEVKPIFKDSVELSE